MNTVEFLSVWEVAHRWNGFDPTKSRIESIPLPVQDTIRSIASDLRREEVLHPHTENGLIGHRGMSARDLHQDLEAALYERRFSHHLLFDVHIARREMPGWCSLHNSELPAFWFTPSQAAAAWEWHKQYEKDEEARRLREVGIESTNESASDKEPPSNRQSQIDKERCQAIALTLWDINPKYTIAALVKHPSIQRYGNGRQYRPDTLHLWLAEVDPRDPEKKIGRPRKLDGEDEKPPAKS